MSLFSASSHGPMGFGFLLKQQIVSCHLVVLIMTLLTVFTAGSATSCSEEVIPVRDQSYVTRQSSCRRLGPDYCKRLAMHNMYGLQMPQELNQSAVKCTLSPLRTSASASALFILLVDLEVPAFTASALETQNQATNDAAKSIQSSPLMSEIEVKLEWLIPERMVGKVNIGSTVTGNADTFEDSLLNSGNRKVKCAICIIASVLALIFQASGSFAVTSVFEEFNGSKVTGLRGFDGRGMLHRSRRLTAHSSGNVKLRKSLFRFMSPLESSIFLIPLLTAAAVLLLIRPVEAMTDLRASIVNGNEPCLHYIFEKNLFLMNCSVLHWQDQGYASDTYISLGINEIFDGGGSPSNRGSYIDLSGIVDFKGLFIIRSGVGTVSEAPVIRNVDVRNGDTAEKGGFIVQQGQQFFVINSCSSTGTISFQGGGLCGHRCGYNNGEIKILNSYSEGKIKTSAGGIAGSQVGYDRGTITITRCYSTGHIEGQYAGGICGSNAGRDSGQVFIKKSYSTGDILPGASDSGGIVGEEPGVIHGYVEIQECFSTGAISAPNSGGISGANAADAQGKIQIADCYTRGDISAQFAGGISGFRSGGCCNSLISYGDFYITNSYASGTVEYPRAGGIIGHVDSNFQARTIRVEYSVYNLKLVGEDDGSHVQVTGNSDNLTSIQSQLYQYGGVQQWHNDTWVINGTDTLPILRFQLFEHPTPTPTPSWTVTPTLSSTTSSTPTSTRTRTATETSSPTKTPTNSRSSSPSSSRSGTTSSTPSPSKSASRSRSATSSPTSSPSKTTTSSTSATASPTSSPSRTPTSSRSATASSTSSRSKTPSRSRSATASSTSSRSKTPSSSSSSSRRPTVTPSESPLPLPVRSRPVQRPRRSVRQMKRRRNQAN